MNTRQRRTRCLGVLALGALLTTAAPTVMAEGPAPDAQALHSAGLEAFKAGRFSEAAEAFVRAHEVDPSASLLWNAARSYDKAGDQPRAREAYQQYNVHAEANRDKITRANAWLEQHPTPRPGAIEEASEPQDTATGGRPVIIRATTPGDSGNDGMGWTLVSLGAAAVIGGTVAMVVAQASRDETEALVWDQDYEATLVRHRSLSATTEQRELAAWLTYGAAVGLVSTGLVLLLSGAENASEVSTGLSSIQVNPSPGGLSASGTWRF
jgi:tetratricopeptide (TPR) repeat protein